VARSEDPRAELGKFLRARRARLRPEDLGLPAAGRRRTPGLRREEVAVTAGISSTWYAYLEQGRAGEVSPAVLNSLARVLQLTEDERRHMHILMYGHVVGPAPLADQMPVGDLFRQTVAIADSFPYPVFALSRAGDAIAWNEATTEWFGDWSLVPGKERNYFFWLFCSERARECVVEWEAFARHIAGRWRADLAKPPDDPTAAKRVAKLREMSSDFARWWDERDVQEHRIDIHHFRHPEMGIRGFYRLSLYTAYEGEGGVIFYIPAD
jgi:transcriptional regulator with XRE-family HTH domain